MTKNIPDVEFVFPAVKTGFPSYPAFYPFVEMKTFQQITKPGKKPFGFMSFDETRLFPVLHKRFFRRKGFGFKTF